MSKKILCYINKINSSILGDISGSELVALAVEGKKIHDGLLLSINCNNVVTIKKTNGGDILISRSTTEEVV